MVLNAEAGLAPEVNHSNNQMSVVVKFCDLKADLAPGQFVSVGRHNVSWGNAVCVDEDELFGHTFFDGERWVRRLELPVAYEEVNRGTLRVPQCTPASFTGTMPTLGRLRIRWMNCFWEGVSGFYHKTCIITRYSDDIRFSF